MYGQQIPRSKYHPLADVIGTIETSPAGNVILRCGQEIAERGWTQHLHIVLTPDEAWELAADLWEHATRKDATR